MIFWKFEVHISFGGENCLEKSLQIVVEDFQII